MGDVDARVHKFAAKALIRDRMASPTLIHIYPGEAPVLILQNNEWRPGQDTKE